MQFEWDRLLPTLDKDFSDILNKVLSCKNKQQHKTISNVNSSTPNEKASV